MDEWLVVEEFPDYEVSTWGRIRNIKTGRMLRPNPNQQGFLMVRLRKDGVSYTRALHRLIAVTFLGDGGRGHSPVHIDDDKWNNRVENLKWRSRFYVYRRSQQKQRFEPLVDSKILHQKTGEVFEDSRAAADACGILEDHVYWCLQDPYVRTAEGHRFEMYYSN